MNEIIIKYNWISVGIFILTMVIAHFFVSSPYDWKNNTISELASQNYDYRWIMKTGFILFGAILTVGVLNKLIQHNGFIINEIPIMIYALAILVSGIYSTKPFVEGIEYSEFHSQIHSYSTQIAGFSFSIGLLIFGIKEIELNLKLIHFAFFAFVIICSALFGLLETNTGIIQRIMYAGSFIWLIFCYNKL